MEVIDTLIYKLGMDNGEFKKKMDESVDQTEELEDKIDELSDSLQSAATFGTVLGNVIYKAMETATNSVRNAINSYYNYIESLRQISRETNQSVEDFQRWSYAIEYAGGNVNSFTSTFERLSKQIRQAPFTHNSTFLRGLSELGVSVHNANGQIKSMSDLLLGLSGRLGGMSESRALLIGQRLGLDDDTIRLLHEGRRSVQEYLDKTKEDGVIQKRNLETYEKLRKIRIELSRNWVEFTNKLGNYILPIVTRLSEAVLAISKVLKENSTFIKHTTDGLGSLLKIIGTILASIYLLGLAFTHLGAILMTSFVGIILGACILAWDDFKTYLEGGDSLIGRLINKIEEFNAVLRDKFVGALGFAKDFWQGFVDFFADKIEWCINLYDRFADKISGLIGWFGIGKDVYEGLSAVSAGVVNNSSNVSNSKTVYDLHGSTIYTRATSAQTFFDDVPQQTMINGEGN